MENRDENYTPIYDETEKDARVAQAVAENNNILFQMIEDHIDGLITRRLLDFCDAHPAITRESKSVPIVHCKS